MPDFEIKGKLLDVSNGQILKVLKTYHNRLKSLWRDSVKAFILATVDKMHVDTGMSVASLAPLGAKVKLQSVILEMARGRGPRLGYTDISGAYNPTQYKSIAHGKSLGSKAYQLEFGTPSEPNLLFIFDIVVFQHKFHEPTWDSIEAGKAAFLDYFNSNFASYIKVDTILGELLGV